MWSAYHFNLVLQDSWIYYIAAIYLCMTLVYKRQLPCSLFLYVKISDWPVTQHVHMWNTSTKQGPSHTGLFWMDIFKIWHRVKNEHLLIWDFRVLPQYVFFHLPVISEWFSNNFAQKNSEFSVVCHIKTYMNRKL